MAKRRQTESGGGGVPEWLCTFSDMMSLLLCFFILLYAMSSMETSKFNTAIGSIQGSLGRIPHLFNLSYIPPITDRPQTVRPLQSVKVLERAKETIAKQARVKLVSEENSKEINVEGVKVGIRFSLTGRILFEAESAVLQREAESILIRVAEILNDFPDLRVRIEGHTDTTPPQSPYPNNWRLAQARAFTVLQFLRNSGNVSENRMSFMSCGEERPRYPNDTEEHRALNRRVEIFLLQGEKSEVIQGILEYADTPKVVPKERDFIPEK